MLISGPVRLFVVKTFTLMMGLWPLEWNRYRSLIRATSFQNKAATRARYSSPNKR